MVEKPVEEPAKPKELTPEQIEQYGHLLFDSEISKAPEPRKMHPRPSIDDPIPWEKVNEVWYNPNYMVQTLDEAVPPA